jgi:hypothetical protein
MREQVWVGIDVGKRVQTTHGWSTKPEPVIFSQAVGNGQLSIEALIAKASAAGVSARWALYMTSGPAALLIALLHAQDQPVSYVPAKLVIRMSGAFAGEGKTDAKDATTIAETARLQVGHDGVVAAGGVVEDTRPVASIGFGAGASEYMPGRV